MWTLTILLYVSFLVFCLLTRDNVWYVNTLLEFCVVEGAKIPSRDGQPAAAIPRKKFEI